jgi:hypothetical protein
MARIRDFQRSKVYEWEAKHLSMLFVTEGCVGLTLDECQDLAKRMYGCKVRVKDGRGSRSARAHTGRRLPSIGLPRNTRTREMIAHEVAHWIVKRVAKGAPSHGGIFMAEYITLLAEHCGYVKETLIKSAIDCGLRVTAIPQPETANQGARQ